LLDSGAIAVFPAGGSTCDKLGLAPYSGRDIGAAEAARSAAPVTAVEDEVNPTDCLSSDAGRQRVEATLASGAFNDCEVVVARGKEFPAEKCATVSIDAPAKTITIAPK
jgi:hypothetical protein